MEWLQECLDGLDSYRELEENWDSYGAYPVSDISIELAKKFLTSLGNSGIISRPSICATPAGTVAFYWIWDNDNQEFNLVFSDIIEYFYYKDDEDYHVHGVLPKIWY